MPIWAGCVSVFKFIWPSQSVYPVSKRIYNIASVVCLGLFYFIVQVRRIGFPGASLSAVARFCNQASAKYFVALFYQLFAKVQITCVNLFCRMIHPYIVSGAT